MKLISIIIVIGWHLPQHKTTHRDVRHTHERTDTFTFAHIHTRGLRNQFHATKRTQNGHTYIRACIQYGTMILSRCTVIGCLSRGRRLFGLGQIISRHTDYGCCEDYSHGPSVLRSRGDNQICVPCGKEQIIRYFSLNTFQLFPLLQDSWFVYVFLTTNILLQLILFYRSNLFINIDFKHLFYFTKYLVKKLTLFSISNYCFL